MKRNIVIVAHKYLTQPDDELVGYLNTKKYKNVLHIFHSFIEAPDRKSYFIWYKDGNVHTRIESPDFRNAPELIIYGKELVYTILWIFRSHVVWDTYIGMDGLCVLFGNILRFLRRVVKTVYWAIDFVPENRFESGLKNRIYHAINTNGYRSSDEMWDLSPRMAAARKKYLGIDTSDYASQKIVPYGMWVNKIKHYSYQICEKKTLVFMGYLVEKQGVQLVIDAMPTILAKIPKFRFKVIGDGAYKNELIALSKKRNVYKNCDFLGKIDDIRELEKEVAKCALAIAPYIKKLDTWTYYADPGKVKTYLACGVPVLLTNVPWNANEIERNNCGKIITEDTKTIASSILDYLDAEKNQTYRKNAVRYAKRFDYETIFSGLSI